MDRFTQFAMAASKMAIEESKLDIENVDNYRMGVIIGTGIGGLGTLEDQHEVIRTKGPGRISPFFVPMMISNMASGRIAIQYKAKGFNECVVRSGDGIFSSIIICALVPPKPNELTPARRGCSNPSSLTNLFQDCVSFTI